MIDGVSPRVSCCCCCRSPFSRRHSPFPKSSNSALGWLAQYACLCWRCGLCNHPIPNTRPGICPDGCFARWNFRSYPSNQSEHAWCPTDDSLPARLWWNCCHKNIPGRMPAHASMLYSKNICNFFLNLYKGDSGKMDLEDEINKEALVTYQGKILHRGTLKAMGEKAR